MLVDEAVLRSFLRLSGEATLHVEDLPGPGRSERVIVSGAEGGESVYVVNDDPEPERAMNHAAVLEALTNTGYPHIPRLVAVSGTATIEEEPRGMALIGLRPDAAMMERAIDALAALHRLDIREGLDQGAEPNDVLPAAEPPLHRLGFAAHERAPALEPFRSAHAALLKTPFGFAHRELTATNVVVAQDAVTFTRFGAAGYGPQLFDVAALLATANVPAPARRDLAVRYASHTGGDPDTIADLVDLAGIAWGVEYELDLPKRQIAVLGDEAGMERLVLESTRIRETFRDPAGEHPLATEIRRALWSQ